jgi:hypothetical protein
MKMLLFTNVSKHNGLPNGFIGQTFVILKKKKSEENLEKHVKAQHSNHTHKCVCANFKKS